MVADAVTLLLHIPPETVLPRVVVAPSHTFRLPDIADGDGLTVTF